MPAPPDFSTNLSHTPSPLVVGQFECRGGFTPPFGEGNPPLESEGRMIRISLKKLALFDCQVLHFGGEFCEKFPKVRCGAGSKGFHR